MARSRTLAVPRPVAVTNDKGEKSIAGEFYEKHVTSGNKWGFPVEKPKPKYQPPPAKPEAPYVPAPWWKPLCDWRWLLALLALLLLILLLLLMPQRPPPMCPVADCTGRMGGKAVMDTCGVCNGFNKDVGCDGVCFSGAIRDAFGGCCKASERGCNGQCFSSPCSCQAPPPRPPPQAPQMQQTQQCRPPPVQQAASQCGVQRPVVQGRMAQSAKWYSG